MDCSEFEAETDLTELRERPELNRVKGFTAYDLGLLSLPVNEHHNETGPRGHKRYMATVEGKGQALVTRRFPLIAMFPEGSLREGVSHKFRERGSA